MRHWLSSIASELDKGHNSEGGLCPFFMVDARNVVPCWFASDKLEYSARTIRTKVFSIYVTYCISSVITICIIHFIHIVYVFCTVYTLCLSYTNSLYTLKLTTNSHTRTHICTLSYRFKPRSLNS